MKGTSFFHLPFKGITCGTPYNFHPVSLKSTGALSLWEPASGSLKKL